LAVRRAFFITVRVKMFRTLKFRERDAICIFALMFREPRAGNPIIFGKIAYFGQFFAKNGDFSHFLLPRD
jgi:hypothetical protein